MLCNLQIISGCVCHLEQLHAQSPFLFPIVFSINLIPFFRYLLSTCCTYLFALFVQLPFSSLSCAGSSWLPLLLVSFPSFTLLPTPNRPCQSERSSKARHEADSFEPAEWSERLTPGQSGWLGAAAVGSIPALALSLCLQRLYFLPLTPFLVFQKAALTLSLSYLLGTYSFFSSTSGHLPVP